MKKITTVLVLGCSIIANYALAALPPKSDRDLVANADYVISALVEGLTEETVENQQNTVTVYTARVRVLNSEKGVLQIGDAVNITYRKIHYRSDGWCGPVGQNSSLSIGQSAHLYLKHSGDSLAALEPNGIKILAGL